jgi:serine protease Do
MASMTTSRPVRRGTLLATVIGVVVAGMPETFSQGATHGWLDWTTAAQAQPVSGGPGVIADIIDKVKPAVVGVRSSAALAAEDQQRLDETWERLFGEPRRQGSAKGNPGAQGRGEANLGSGFFISPDGYIVTTNHVVEGSRTIEITTDEAKTYTARMIGSDPRTDLALLKVDDERSFPSVPLAAKTPRIGEWVVAVGNPFGLGGTVTAGIVSARARDIKIGMLNDFVQIDAPMNQGNSGGPTFDLQGDVVGVNSAIFSPSGGSIGIGFAIPAETVAEVVTKLRERGAVVRGWLGVQIETVTPEMARMLGTKETRGALVVEPDASGPAAKAGIAAGDVIRTVNGEAVQDDRELVRRIASLEPGSTVSLDISRKEDRRTVDVTIAEMPDARPMAPPPARRPRINP